MKKYFIVALAALFVLGFAASSFAIHAEIPAETQAVVAKSATQITIGGEIRVRGDMRVNTSDFNNDTTGTGGDRHYYDERVRLQIEAKVTPNTMGLIQLETNGGVSNNADNYTWGSNVDGRTGTAPFNLSEGARGSVLVGNQKQSSFSILQAWILHQGTGLLGVPALVKVGHMPITIGTGLFYDHSYQGDDALLVGVDPVKNLHIIVGTVKALEANITTNNDVTGYALLVNYDINKDSAVGLDITYVDDQNNGIGGLNNVFPALPDDFATSGTWDTHFWNIGLNAKTKIANKVGLYGEVDVQRGSVVDTANNPGFTSDRANRDQKFRGYAAKAGVTFSLAPAPVTLGFEAAIGSGDANRNDGRIKNFITSQGATQHFTYVYDYRTANASGNVQGGLQNTEYLKASAAADITKDLSANMAVYYLRAVNKVDNALGAQATGISTGTYTTANSSRNIGWEVDSVVTYKIDRNLNYFVEGGYLFAGNFWRGANGAVNGATSPYKDMSPADAYVVRHGIQLSF